MRAYPTCRFLLLATLVVSPTLLACPAKRVPLALEPDRYAQIFVGEVVGIRLSGYLTQSDSFDRAPYTDTTPQHDLEIRLIKTIKGNVPNLVFLSAGGCGIREPAPREIGLFAVQPGGLVYPLYERERPYSATLIDITMCVAGKCRPRGR